MTNVAAASANNEIAELPNSKLTISWLAALLFGRRAETTFTALIGSSAHPGTVPYRLIATRSNSARAVCIYFLYGRLTW
jgi:membrane protein YqaA with SNARE-associated domain